MAVTDVSEPSNLKLQDLSMYEIEEQIEALSMELGQLQVKREEYRKKRDVLNQKAADLAERRNAFNEKARIFRETALEEKQNRDAINQKINDLKKDLQPIEEEISSLEAQKREIKDQIEELEELLPRRGRRQLSNSKDIEKQIQALEFKLQTTSNLTVEQESAIINQIAELESHKSVVQQLQELRRRLRALESNINYLYRRRNKLKELINNKSSLSRQYHKNMLQAFSQADVFKKRADEYHQELLETRKEATSMHQLFVETSQRLREVVVELKMLRDERRNRINRQRQRHIEEITDQAFQEAYEKYKAGKKLEFDEFWVLVKKGII